MGSIDRLNELYVSLSGCIFFLFWEFFPLSCTCERLLSHALFDQEEKVYQ